MIGKLPANWRQHAYKVELQPNERDRHAFLSNGSPDLRDAIEGDWDIVASVVGVANDNHGRAKSSFRVEFFGNNLLLATWPCSTLKDAILIAETFGRNFARAIVLNGTDSGTTEEFGLTLASELLEAEPEPLSWHVPKLIPAGLPTLLFGDGGTGKSLAALQLAVATSANRPWLGHHVRQGPAIFMTAEDDEAEVHRRIATICAREGIDRADLDYLMVNAKVGEDALLGIWNPDTRMIEPTALYNALDRAIQTSVPALLVLDTLADLFGGDENVRAQARQFVTLLRRLSRHCGTTIVCLAHPSAAGISSGTGSSGSTGWSNSVRSRLYLERSFEWAGRSDSRRLVEPDPNVRILTTKKSNYGPVGGAQRLRWSDGVIVVDTAPLMIAGPAKASAIMAGEQVDEKFLELLTVFRAQGRNVSPSPSASYGPSLFAKHPRAEGIKKAAFVESLRRLLDAGQVVVEPYGPPSKGTKRLALPADAGGADPAYPPADAGAD
ncbi:AAA family ATPase [Aureimonas mangrovi]|uniref:AAA family ATPase n=1 Tax=Aureimonas mangrovi TaxID=2758041 RepID=UPI00163D9A4C|nr:AAA family ATPase [Aureimonas mangrovi]